MTNNNDSSETLSWIALILAIVSVFALLCSCSPSGGTEQPPVTDTLDGPIVFDTTDVTMITNIDGRELRGPWVATDARTFLPADLLARIPPARGLGWTLYFGDDPEGVYVRHVPATRVQVGEDVLTFDEPGLLALVPVDRVGDVPGVVVEQGGTIENWPIWIRIGHTDIGEYLQQR